MPFIRVLKTETNARKGKENMEQGIENRKREPKIRKGGETAIGIKVKSRGSVEELKSSLCMSFCRDVTNETLESSLHQ